ncbi:DUF421 domain-containing protein [Metabacillus idriensis]|uniref:DUF421 domain-containing protein n=1 Tax=Metabacillus idriensis TaxID=324768 RepID=A0A6I2M542_9BACI|nr:DUF421 domain-containing protein [Metabacillus idriensis]MCM3594701.1 DUF421 domain-containing protein [Metabacillus idriensis]MRX53275.1 DUF421 domain-containing protein [Metabacillus idriensis]OHR68633.1 hypothetical protein HMPREF3291_08885 [Bacillus sp. HMSC76G11]
MLDWIDIIIRTFTFLIALFLLTKWLGKKQLAELSFFEYVTGITIGSIAAEVTMGLERNIMHGLISMTIWTIFPIMIGFFSLKSKKIRDFVEGKATVVIKDGKVMEENLKKERYTTDELLEQLRNKSIFQVSDVEFAVIEPNGDLSVMLKREKQPLTANDLQIKVASVKEPQTIIMDGNILDEPLSTRGFNRGWLNEELEKIGVSVDNVFLGQIDSDGQLTIDLYDDQINVPSPQEKPLLLASLKKCQADLELFSLQTESKEAKQMYLNNSKRVDDILNKLLPILQNN